MEVFIFRKAYKVQIICKGIYFWRDISNKKRGEILEPYLVGNYSLIIKVLAYLNLGIDCDSDSSAALTRVR